MIRLFALVAVVATMSFTISCSSKKKADDGVAVGEVGADADVASKDMMFDPLGSDSGNIAGLNTIYFAYDSSALTSEARRELANNADWVKSNSNVTIQIEGHCDSRGSVEYNLALGERRAQSVKDYLVSLGIDARRLTIISYGKEKPIAQGDDESAFTRNRRANFVPLPN